MEVNGSFGRVEVIHAGTLDQKPSQVASFNCSKEVFTILTSDELPLVQREIVENALELLGIQVDDEDWETLQVRAISLH